MVSGIIRRFWKTSFGENRGAPKEKSRAGLKKSILALFFTTLIFCFGCPQVWHFCLPTCELQTQLNPESGARDKRWNIAFREPHFQRGAPRRIFCAPVGITAALPNPTKQCKNRGFLACHAAHPIFERIPGSIIERSKRKKAPLLRTQQHAYIYIEWERESVCSNRDNPSSKSNQTETIHPTNPNSNVVA